MRLLIDEDINVRLRHYFPRSIEAETVRYREWNGLKNSDLLRRAEREYDVLLTIDTHLKDQQDVSRFDIGVVVICAGSDQIEDLLPLVPQVHAALLRVKPGQLIEVFPE